MLFQEYAAHRASERGREEIGWILLGYRSGSTAWAVATIPAGANRDAGEAHVRFNSEAQAVATRILRQEDRKLVSLGVVHTHPGTLRHPSHGDWQGDRAWVANLRGEEGVFGIGTVDTEARAMEAISRHPQAHIQTWGGLRFDWYTLRAGQNRYQPVAVSLEIGPDLAAEFRPVWDILETHAPRIERLAQQFRSVRYELGESGGNPALLVRVGLGGGFGGEGESVNLLLLGKTIRLFHESKGDSTPWDGPADLPPDQAVYLLLAERASCG
jgi:proteasome lid subunit RPN8/RPN11